MKYWYETLAVAQRILIELGRRRRSLILWSIFPVSILLINGLILKERANLTTAKAFETAAPASLVGAALFFSCLGGSVATVVAEREQHTLKRLFISPLSGTSYFLGIFLAHSCIGIGQVILVYTIASCLGAQFQGSILLGICDYSAQYCILCRCRLYSRHSVCEAHRRCQLPSRGFRRSFVDFRRRIFADFTVSQKSARTCPVQSNLPHERSTNGRVG